MSAPMKKAIKNDVAKNRPVFAPEVFKPHDDVTPEGLAFLRERVKSKVEGRKWTRIEGSALSNAC